MSASRVVRFPSGIDYVVPTELTEYFARIGGEPEKPLIEWARRFLRPDGVFVDVGAHIGTYALSYAPGVRETHAFEPQRDTFHRLCGGIALRGNDSIHAHNIALSDENFVRRELRVLTSDGGLSSLCELPTNQHPVRTETVMLATLDSYGLDDVCLVKIDVEGHELQVLRGMVDTLRRSDYPPLLVEVWTEAWFAEEREKILAYLTELGYAARPADGFPHMLVCEHRERRAPAPEVVQAIPEDRKKKKRLLLTMIVKNETRVIERSLETMLPHVDGFSICDTGSVDGTPFVIKQIAAKHGVRGTVHSTEWKNYGHNRTVSAILAREWVRDRGWDPADTYLLFCDADMKLHVATGFRKEFLIAPSYRLPQGTPGHIYPNTRLARADLDWRSVGVTHEFWAAEGGEVNVHTLPQELMWLEDGNDGGNRSTKFERDRELLEQGLLDEPDNERYMFYLAQTYFDLGEFEKATEMYERRYQAGGYVDERMYSRLKRGRALLALGKREGVDVLLQTFEEFPHRVDPLFYLAVYYRERGENRTAAHFIQAALRVPPAPTGGLFMEQDIYDWRLDWEQSIGCYYTGDHETGRAAAERVMRLRRAGIPYELSAANQVHYTKPLTLTASGRLTPPAELLAQGETLYESSSPTVARLGERLVLGVRLVNYDHAKGRSFVSRDSDRVIRTRELRVFMPDSALATPVAEQWEEIAQNIPSDWPGAHVDGLEDQRFIELEGRVWFTANTWRTPAAAGRPQMVLGRLNREHNEVDHLVPLSFPGAASIEKNWLPFVDEGELRLVYGYDPLVVLAVTLESGVCAEVCRHIPRWPGHRFRGSAGPVRHPCREGHWLLLVHEVAVVGDERIYSQRLMELDETYRPLTLSPPFFLDHRGVEFPLGFIQADADHALITYGREERESCYAIVAWSELLSRLSP